MDVRHFVIIECSHLANGCTMECGCIGLMLIRYLSCLGAIIRDTGKIICFGICMQSVMLWRGKLCNRSL